MNYNSIFVVIGLIACQARAITLFCERNDDVLTMTFRQVVDDSSNQLEAIKSDTLATAGCVSHQKTVGSDLTNELSITISLISETQTSPTSNCYVKAVDRTSKTVFKVSVAVQKVPGMLRFDEQIFKGSCNSDVETSEVDLGDNSVTVLNSITQTPLQAAASDRIEMELVDANGFTVDAVDLGERVRLIAYYYHLDNADIGEFPVLLQLQELFISGYEDFRTSFNLITSNGCLNKTTADLLSMHRGMKYGPRYSDPNNGYHASTSGLFSIPLLEGPAPKNFYLKASYNKLCLYTEDPQCVDQEQYCEDNNLDQDQKRKRRSATELDHDVLATKQHSPNLAGVDLARVKRNAPAVESKGTVQFAVPIAIQGDAVQARRFNHGRNGGTKSKVCEVSDMYWIISVVLGVLLLAIMALCMFLVLRLRKEQNHNDKIAEKIGHKNPGYY